MAIMIGRHQFDSRAHHAVLLAPAIARLTHRKGPKPRVVRTVVMLGVEVPIGIGQRESRWRKAVGILCKIMPVSLKGCDHLGIPFSAQHKHLMGT